MKSFWNSMIAAFASYSVIPMPNIELTEDESKYQFNADDDYDKWVEESLKELEEDDENENY